MTPTTVIQQIIVGVIFTVCLYGAGFILGLGIISADNLVNDRGFDWNCDGQLKWLRGYGEKYDTLTCVTDK